jgi:hypothetical protein
VIWSLNHDKLTYCLVTLRAVFYGREKAIDKDIYRSSLNLLCSHSCDTWCMPWQAVMWVYPIGHPRLLYVVRSNQRPRKPNKGWHLPK